MPHKTRIVETQPDPRGTEQFTASTASDRSRRPARSPSPATKKASSGPRTRSSRRSGSPSLGFLADAAEGRPPAESAGALAATEPTSKGARPARKGGIGKKTPSISVESGRSSSVKGRSRRTPAREGGTALQAHAAAELHPKKAFAAEDDGRLDHDEVARLAYSYWEARGHQGGSPEDDWFRAQNELRRRRKHLKAFRPAGRARKDEDRESS